MDKDKAWNMVASFLTSLALEKGLSVNSRLGYQRDLGDLIEFCIREDIKDWNGIKTSHITSYIGELYDLGIAPATVMRIISILSRISWAMSNNPIMES